MVAEKQWFYNNSGQAEGPFTSSQLKELADSQIINPQSLVRLGTSGPWSHASFVKGLFPETSNDTPQNDLIPKPLSVSSSSGDIESPYPKPSFVSSPSAVPGGLAQETASLPSWIKSVPSAPQETQPNSAAKTGNPAYPLSSPPLPNDPAVGPEALPRMQRLDNSDDLKYMMNPGSAAPPPNAFHNSGSLPGSDAETSNNRDSVISDSPLPASDPTETNGLADHMYNAALPFGLSIGNDSSEEGGKKLPKDLQILLRNDEQVLYADNPSPIIMLIKCFLGLICWFLFGFLPSASCILLGAGSQGFSWMLTCTFVFGILVLILYICWRHQFYVITDQRTIVRGGFFRVSISILFNSQIKTVFIFSTLVSRFLGLYMIQLSNSDCVPRVIGTFFASSGVCFYGVKIKRITQIYNSILHN